MDQDEEVRVPEAAQDHTEDSPEGTEAGEEGDTPHGQQEGPRFGSPTKYLDIGWSYQIRLIT